MLLWVKILLISLFPFVPIILYLLLLLIVSSFHTIISNFRKKNNEKKEITKFPSISIIVPTHNEEKIIKHKIRNLLELDYPSPLKIIFVDDSDDKTPKIIEEFKKQYSEIKMIHTSKRIGYNNAIIQGIKATEDQIIVITDSHSMIDKEAIKLGVKLLLRDEKIGSISGKGILINSEVSSSKLESIYQFIFNSIRKLETLAGSNILVRGELCILRTRLVSDIEKIKGCFDNESSLWIKKRKYKTIYSDKILFYEKFPTKINERFKQKQIRAVNLLRSLLREKTFFLNPKYGFFGLCTYPFYIYLFFIFPILFLFSIIGITSSLIMILISINYYLLASLISFIILIFIIPKSRRIVISILQLDLSLLYAIFVVLFKSNIDLSQVPMIESTRII